MKDRTLLTQGYFVSIGGIGRRGDQKVPLKPGRGGPVQSRMTEVPLQGLRAMDPVVKCRFICYRYQDLTGLTAIYRLYRWS